MKIGVVIEATGGSNAVIFQANNNYVERELFFSNLMNEITARTNTPNIIFSAAAKQCGANIGSIIVGSGESLEQYFRKRISNKARHGMQPQYKLSYSLNITEELDDNYNFRNFLEDASTNKYGFDKLPEWNNESIGEQILTFGARVNYRSVVIENVTIFSSKSHHAQFLSTPSICHQKYDHFLLQISSCSILEHSFDLPL